MTERFGIWDHDRKPTDDGRENPTKPWHFPNIGDGEPDYPVKPPVFNAPPFENPFRPTPLKVIASGIPASPPPNNRSILPVSFKKYALTALFAAAAGAGGTVFVADRYIQHEMATGQPCEVYKNTTKWMNRYSKDAQDPTGNQFAAVNYSEEQIGQAKVCSATGGAGQGKDVAAFVHKFKGLFQ